MVAFTPLSSSPPFRSRGGLNYAPRVFVRLREERAGCSWGAAACAPRYFVAANGKPMPNEGEIGMRLLAPLAEVGPQPISSTFQVAAVTRPLLSVSHILDTCSAGSEPVFKRHGAEIKNSTLQGLSAV